MIGKKLKIQSKIVIDTKRVYQTISVEGEKITPRAVPVATGRAFKVRNENRVLASVSGAMFFFAFFWAFCRTNFSSIHTIFDMFLTNSLFFKKHLPFLLMAVVLLVLLLAVYAVFFL